MIAAFSGKIRATVPLLIALAVSASGCETEEKKREYPVPESLCGLDFGSDLIAPFLPPGVRIHQTENNDDTNWSCEVSVDGVAVFYVKWEFWEPGWSPRRYAPSQAYVDPENEAADGSYVYSGEGAVTAVRCADQEKDWDIFLVVKVWNEGIPDAEAMEKFITTYRRELEKRDPCADI